MPIGIPEGAASGNATAPTDDLLNSAFTPSGSLFAEGIRDDISNDWANQDPAVVLQTTATGSANVGKVLSQARWYTGTTAGSTLASQTYETMFYSSAHGVVGEFTTQFVGVPSAPNVNGYILIGPMAVGGTDGFAIGYKGNVPGLFHRKSGVTDFTPFTSFNIDQLAGTVRSLYTRLGVPVAANLALPQRWRLVGALLGAETWTLQARSPDRSWVTCHEFFWINETIDRTANGNVVDVFDFRLRVEANNDGAGENLEVRNGSWRCGLQTSEPSDFTKLLQRYVHDTDELRLDVEPTTALVRSVNDGVLNGTTTVTSATANFSQSDVGASISGGSIPPNTTIASVTNSTTATISNPASGSASGVTLTITQPIYFIGVGPDGFPTSQPGWKIMGIYQSATRNPNRIRFRKNVAWDQRTQGWT